MNYKSCAICHKAKTPICNHCTGFDKFEKALWAEDFESEIRADERNNILDKVNVLIQTRLIDALTLGNATKYGNLSAEQQSNSYATVMKYEIADCVYDLIDDLEELKEQK